MEMFEKPTLDKAVADGWGLTFDDVLIVPMKSEVVPRDVDLRTRLSKNIEMSVPLVSADMDTVTEAEMGRGMAMLGGIGFLWKSPLVEDQVSWVNEVKFTLNARIERPISVYEDNRVSYVLKTREEKGWGFHSFPVLSNSGTLVGIVTGNDFEFCGDTSLFIKFLNRLRNYGSLDKLRPCTDYA